MIAFVLSFFFFFEIIMLYMKMNLTDQNSEPMWAYCRARDDKGYN